MWVAKPSPLGTAPLVTARVEGTHTRALKTTTPTPSGPDVAATTRPQKRQKVVITCPRPGCKSKLQSQETLKKHLRTHIVKDVIQELPSGVDLLAECLSRAVLVILAMCGARAPSPIPESKRQLSFLLRGAMQTKSAAVCLFLGRVGLRTCEAFEPTYKNEPWEMLEKAYSGVQEQMENEEIMGSLLQALKNCIELPSHMKLSSVKGFLHTIVLDVCDSSIGWFCQRIVSKLKASEPTPSNGSGKSISKVEEAAVHYASGSHVKGFERTNKHFANISTHSGFTEFLRQDFESVEKEVQWFTEAVNRGGLTFIGKPYFKFALGILTHVKAVDDVRDLSHDKIIKRIENDSPLMSLWHGITEKSTAPEHELNALWQVCCRKLISLFVKGKILMIRNCSEAAPKASISLRAHVAAQGEKSVT